MSGFFYPTLDPATIQALSVIQSLVAEHPDYFQSPDCPYGLETENLLAKWFKRKVVLPDGSEAPNVPDPNAPPEAMFEGLREEITSAYLHLKLAKNDTHQDKVAYAKTAVALLEKLVKMEAMVVNIEMIGKFQTAVISFVEDVCTPEQVKQFMARVKEYIAPDVEHIDDISKIKEITE